MFIYVTKGIRNRTEAFLYNYVIINVTFFISQQMQKLLILIFKNKQYENDRNCSRRRFI